MKAKKLIEPPDNESSRVFKLYPLPFQFGRNSAGAHDGRYNTCSFQSKSLGLVAALCFRSRPADNACGAWHMWMPDITVAEDRLKPIDYYDARIYTDEYAYRLDIDKLLPEGSITTQRDFIRYAQYTTAHGLLTYSVRQARPAGFCQDGSRHVVDLMMDELPRVKRVFDNGFYETADEEEMFERHARQFKYYDLDPVINKFDFPSSHGNYECTGYCFTLGETPWADNSGTEQIDGDESKFNHAEYQLVSGMSKSEYLEGGKK